MRFNKKPETPEKLFAQVIKAGIPKVLQLWEEGDSFISKAGLQCPSELELNPKVGRSFYQCQPHFWQCFWQGGVGDRFPALKIDVFGQTYHLKARASFPAIPAYSPEPRYYQLLHATADLPLKDGMVVELEIKELPGFSQSILLTDSCRDTFLPERIYAYGEAKEKKNQGFIWDNFGRKIFIDRFYVSRQQVNEWYLAKNQPQKISQDRKDWGLPTYLPLKEQKNFCAFYGKRLLEAKLFDAATMTPVDLKDPQPKVVNRPETPWQRDLSKTFLGVARINPDYQLTPLDCQLAQVEGCQERYFTTDSATWMGIYFGMGYEKEAYENRIEPEKNLKLSSKSLPPASPWHQLGKRTHWQGEQDEKDQKGVAFRCYEEVSL